jgi:hypothetical protein
VNSITAVQDGRHRWLVVACLIVVALAAALRLAIVDRQGLWADEAFSLAMATGHSLEHPPSEAKPELGDYIEAPRPLPALEYRRYLEHQNPPVGPAGVIRAVRLSDTSPPLYYLLLWAWTRLGGTSDGALRSFSVFWALACFPFVWSLAEQIGGRRSILPACLLFAVFPVSIHYSVEGRMYSMLWFLALGLAWLTLRLHRRGPGVFAVAIWILVAAAGLMTHYFYGFVLAAFVLWLMLYPGRFSRGWVVGLGGAVVLVVAPWYIKLPLIFSTWRLTGNWLLIPSGNRTIASVQLPWSLVSFSGFLRSYSYWDFVLMAVLIMVAIVVLFRAGPQMFSKEVQLLVLWMLAACLGPVLFDFVFNTYVTLEPRYAMTGMPAALLLIAFGLGRLSPGWSTLCVAVIILSWLPHVRYVLTNPWRYWEPFRQMAGVIEKDHRLSDIVLVHSTPTGIASLARYLDPAINIFSWVGPLNQRRVPEDVQILAERYNRIVFIKIHTVGEPRPEEEWLLQHAALERQMAVEAADLKFFLTRPHSKASE